MEVKVKHLPIPAGFIYPGILPAMTLTTLHSSLAQCAIQSCSRGFTSGATLALSCLFPAFVWNIGALQEACAHHP